VEGPGWGDNVSSGRGRSKQRSPGCWAMAEQQVEDGREVAGRGGAALGLTATRGEGRDRGWVRGWSGREAAGRQTELGGTEGIRGRGGRGGAEDGAEEQEEQEEQQEQEEGTKGRGEGRVGRGFRAASGSVFAEFLVVHAKGLSALVSHQRERAGQAATAKGASVRPR